MITRGNAITVAVISLLGAASARADADSEMPSTLPDAPGAAITDHRPPPLRFEGTFGGLLTAGVGQDHEPIAYGFAVTYGVAWGALPLLLGLDFMSTNTGDSSALIALGRPADDSTSRVSKLARDRTLYFDLWLRVQPPQWPVRPYVEGFIGTKLLQTRYTLKLDASDTSASSDAVSDHAWANSYGWGVGVDFWGLFNAGGTVSLTLGVRQLRGADIHFERALQVTQQPGVASYSVGTSVFMFMAGIMGRFDLGAEPDPYTTAGPY